jgi:choline dehydrogenase-like flavoprotein
MKSLSLSQFTYVAAALSSGISVSATPLSRLRYAHVLARAEQVKESYDYVIVGGGTAGLTLADRLTEDRKTTVLVIEYGRPITEAEIIAANGRDYFPNLGLRFNITSTPQPGMNGRTQEVVVGCALGGSSTINGMVYVRGNKEDYDGWKVLGGPGSTWDWNGMLPYFKKATHFNPPNPELAKQFNMTYDPNAWRVQNPDSKLEASYPSGVFANVLPMYDAMAKMPGVPIPKDGAGGKHGLFWNPHSMDDQKYWRSYARTAHYDNIQRPNYHVITMHKVTKILFQGKSTVASGVEYLSREDPTNSKLTVKARKEVILSAGAVHTPQLLQLSGIGPEELLKQANIPTLVDLPGVGQNFQDHAFIVVTYQWANNGTGPPGPNLTAIGDPLTAYGPTIGAWLSMPVVSPQNYQTLAARYEAQSPGAYLAPGTDASVVAGYAEFQRLHAKMLRSPDSTFMWLPLANAPFLLPVAQHITSMGTINIDPANPTAEPVVDYRALSNPIDMDIVIEMIQFWRRYIRSAAFAAYGPIELTPPPDMNGDALKQWIRDNYISSVYHPIGTASKKPRRLGGVVDEELLVHGTRRLRVVDASVVPLLPAANTQQTVYMLAEKAVDMIKAAG